MKTLRRWLLWFQMTALEITIDGMSECLECVSDPERVNRIIMAQINARNELRKVRRDYMALRDGSAKNGWRLAL
jgi:hypothetical protein